MKTLEQSTSRKEKVIATLKASPKRLRLTLFFWSSSAKLTTGHTQLATGFSWAAFTFYRKP